MNQVAATTTTAFSSSSSGFVTLAKRMCNYPVMPYAWVYGARRK